MRRNSCWKAAASPRAWKSPFTGRIHQSLNLFVHAAQRTLHPIHGFGDAGLMAGQTRHIHRQITHRIVRDDIDHLPADRDMGLHQSIDRTGHRPIHPGKAPGIELMFNHPALMLPGVLRLRLNEAPEHLDHSLHGQQQLPGLVPACHLSIRSGRLPAATAWLIATAWASGWLTLRPIRQAASAPIRIIKVVATQSTICVRLTSASKACRDCRVSAD